MSAFGDPGIRADYAELLRSLGVDDLVSRTTYRMNHTECGDTRRRLYFTSAYEDGKDLVKAYCHNCSKGGIHSVSAHSTVYVRWAAPVEDYQEASAAPPLPEDLEAHRIVDDYLGSYGLTADDVRASWSPSLGRIVIPIYDSELLDVTMHTEQYLGYVARAVPGTSRRVPKWLSAKGREPLATWFCKAPDAPNPGCVVFTEDVLSAAKISAADHASCGVPLFGLNIQPEMILKRMKQAPLFKPVVWLDNDAPSVKARQRLAGVLRAFGYDPFTVINLPEPKKCDLGKIGHALDVAQGVI